MAELAFERANSIPQEAEQRFARQLLKRKTPLPISKLITEKRFDKLCSDSRTLTRDPVSKVLACLNFYFSPITCCLASFNAHTCYILLHLLPEAHVGGHGYGIVVCLFVCLSVTHESAHLAAIALRLQHDSLHTTSC